MPIHPKIGTNGEDFCQYANLASYPHDHRCLGGVSAPSTNIYETEWFLGASDAGFLQSLDSCDGEIKVDLHVFLLRKTMGGLSERPDATVVIGDLGDDVLGVLREILYNYRFGFLAGV